MTRFDVIRQMSDDELVSLLKWGISFSAGIELPDCSDTCPDCESGCALKCSIAKKERVLRAYLSEEIDADD